MRKTKTFFRSVSHAELEDWQKTGSLRAGPNSIDGKYLTDSVDHALDWWHQFSSLGWFGTEGGGAVLQVEVLAEVAVGFESLGENLDGIGTGWVADVSSLKDAKITVVQSWSTDETST